MNILINRTDAIGDVLLTMPMARALKQHLKDATVIFLVAERTAPLFENHPFVDKVWILPPTNSLMKKWSFLRQKMKETKIDACFHCAGSFLPSMAALFSKVPFRGGLLSKWPSFILLNKGVRQSRTAQKKHEVRYNLELLEPLGINITEDQTESYAPVVGLSSEERKLHLENFQRELVPKRELSTRPMVFVHPGMSGTSSRNWPPESYAKLVETLSARHPDKFLFVISFTPSDNKYMDPFKEYMASSKRGRQEDIVYFNGARVGLRGYMAVLSHGALMIAPGTGNTHMANALNIPQVAVYSPIKSQAARRWGPFLKNKAAIVEPDVECPASRFCKGPACADYDCMADITVEKVCQEALNILEKHL